MPLYTKKNWAKGKIANTLGIGDTLLEMQIGHTLPKNGTFPIVVWNMDGFPDPGDDPGVEIVVCSYIGIGSSGLDTYSIARAQDNTFESTHFPGAQVALNITAGVGYADMGVIGTKVVDETGISDEKGIVYDSVVDKLLYKPIIPGLYDNDLNMFLLYGASNLSFYNVEFIAVVEFVNFVIFPVEVNEQIFVWENLDLSIDFLFLDVFETITITESGIDMLSEFSVEDTVAVSESIEVGLDQLVPNVFDDITILDVALMNDLVIELGTVFDDILISEAYDFTGAEFSVEDTVAVTEDILTEIELDLLILDAIAITEDIVEGLDPTELLVWDDVNIIEDAVLDMTVEFNEGDSITTTEDFAVDLILGLDGSDDIAVSEDFAYNII